jgi:hypothetical protein
MALAIVWAFLLGAGLGLDRSLRGLPSGTFVCAATAGAGAALANMAEGAGLTQSLWVWPFAAALIAVGIGYYLARATAPAPRVAYEPQLALFASAAFGLAVGLGATRLAGLMTMISIFALAWRPLDETAPQVAPAAAQPTPAAPEPFARKPFTTAPSMMIEIGRRAEEGRNDNESRHQREEQRQREQLAHAGGAGVAGQA